MKPLPRSGGALIFQSPNDMLAAMFGPPQHEQHVIAYRRHDWLTKQLAAYDAASACLDQFVQEKIAEMRAERAR